MIDRDKASITVSVIIPAYNAEAFLAQSIESVLGQSATPAEVIVVDDGSTDRTSDIAKSFGAAVRLLRQEHAGVSTARNAALRIALGELIAFQDADDVWLPNKLELQLEHLQQHPDYALVYTDLSEVDSALNLLHPSKYRAEGLTPAEGYIFQRQVVDGLIFPPTVLMKASVLQTVGFFEKRLQVQEDTEFFNRVTFEYKVGFLPCSTVLRRRHAGNVSNNYNEHSLRANVVIARRAREMFPLSLGTRWRLRVRLGRRYARLSRHDLGQCRRHQARTEALESLKEWPFTLAPLWLLISFFPDAPVRALRRAKQRVSSRARANSRGQSAARGQ